MLLVPGRGVQGVSRESALHQGSACIAVCYHGPHFLEGPSPP